MRPLAAIGAAATVMFAALPAPAAVMFNEIVVKGAERVELYNSGFAAVDVNDWTIESDGGAYVIQGLGPVPAQGYAVVDLPGSILLENGGFIELLDDVGPDGQDGVWYGQRGSAPLPPDGELFGRALVAPSLARAPDGSSYGIPPSHSPITDGQIWTIDFSPTFGAANDAPNPALGSTALLNEVDPKPVGGLDTVELFNPSALGVGIAAWILTNGAAVQALAGTVPGGGFLDVATSAGFDVEDTELLYLFDAAGVRVDQLGFHLPPVRNAPTLDVCQCYARFADGDGPNLGYDWLSSGGNSTLFALVCTPEASNAFETECATAAPEPGRHESWGRAKARWR